MEEIRQHAGQVTATDGAFVERILPVASPVCVTHGTLCELRTKWDKKKLSHFCF